MTIRCRAIAGWMLATAMAGPAGATSFYLNEQSTKAAGRAFSGEAADQGPEELWWNPAAIAGTRGIQASLGASLIAPHADVQDRGSTIARPGQPAAPVGGNARPDNPAKSGVLPSGAISVGVTDRIALGLALTSPFSFETNYDAGDWTRYLADKTRLRTIDIQPSVGVMLTDTLRVGAAINVEYTAATLSKYLPNLLATLPDGQQRLKGSGWDAGWSAGGQYVGKGFSVGLAYKSAIRHKLDGTLRITGLLGPLAGANTQFDTRATFRTPWQAIGSVRVDVARDVTLNAQVTRFGWGEFDRVTLTMPAGAFVPEEYRDTWTIAGGVDWRAGERWTLRGGVYRDQTPTQDRRRDPNVPDGNRTAVALGLSHKMGSRLTIDVAGEYLFFDKSSIDRGTIDYAGSGADTVIVTNGALAAAHALVFGLGARAAF